MLVNPTAKELQVYTIGWHRFLYVTAGRGEELRLHLASHGIKAEMQPIEESGQDRLELLDDSATDTVQTILDQWEK